MVIYEGDSSAAALLAENAMRAQENNSRLFNAKSSNITRILLASSQFSKDQQTDNKVDVLKDVPAFRRYPNLRMVAVSVCVARFFCLSLVSTDFLECFG